MYTPPAGPGCLGSAVAAAEGEGIAGARYSPDGTLVAISGERGSVVVWDAATADEVARIPNTTAVVDALAFSSDGRLLALGDRSGLTRLVDARTGQVRAELEDGTAVIFAVAFTPDGHLLTGDGQGVVRLWDVASRTNRTMLRAEVTSSILRSMPQGVPQRSASTPRSSSSTSSAIVCHAP